MLEGFQAAFLAARPAGHRCGGSAARAAGPRDDLPAMISYLASARFGPALLSTYARQARRSPLACVALAKPRHGVSFDTAGRQQGTLRPRAAAPAPCSVRTRGAPARTSRSLETGEAGLNLGFCSGQLRKALRARSARRRSSCTHVQAVVELVYRRGSILDKCRSASAWRSHSMAVWREQAQEFDDDEDEEGDDGEYEGDDSEDEGDDGEEVQLMYEEEADDAGPIEGAWGGEFVEDGDVGEARAALLGLSKGFLVDPLGQWRVFDNGDGRLWRGARQGMSPS